jgi:hypothetical protein
VPLGKIAPIPLAVPSPLTQKLTPLVCNLLQIGMSRHLGVLVKQCCVQGGNLVEKSDAEMLEERDLSILFVKLRRELLNRIQLAETQLCKKVQLSLFSCEGMAVRLLLGRQLERMSHTLCGRLSTVLCLSRCKGT